MKPLQRYLLICILVLGSFLRLWNLDRIPSGFHGDEALTGYTAYSLLKTGLDLEGRNAIFAFADINGGGTFPALYSWILVPFVAVLGLEPYVDRLPSALLGILSIYILFVLVRECTKKESVALVAAFLMAINPWSIHISRQGLLESAALNLILLGAVLFLQAEGNWRKYFWSMLAFSLSLFAYDAPRLFLLLFIPMLVIYQWPVVLKQKNVFIWSTSLFGLSVLILVKQIAFGGEIGEYTKSSPVNWQEVSQRVQIESQETFAPLWLSSLYHNPVTVTYKKMLTKYAIPFSLNWLFVNGDPQLQSSVGNKGEFLIFEIITMSIGVYILYRHWRKLGYFLTAWIIFGALPYGLSVGGSPVYRNCLIIPAYSMISAVGLEYLWNTIFSRARHPQILKLIFSGVIFFTFVSYAMTYFLDYPVYSAEFWSKQQNDAISYAITQTGNYNNIILDGNKSWANMYALKQNMDPARFQSVMKNPDTFGTLTDYTFDTVHFVSIPEYLKELPSASLIFPKNSLVIVPGRNEYFPDDVPIVFFYDPGGVRSVYKAIVVQ